jgi:hypothetical protein
MTVKTTAGGTLRIALELGQDKWLLAFATQAPRTKSRKRLTGLDYKPHRRPPERLRWQPGAGVRACEANRKEVGR